MPSDGQALVSLVSQLALSFDGVVLGVALAYVAVRSFATLASHSKALKRIREAPPLHVSDLRALLPDHDPDLAEADRVVIVTGRVEARSVAEGASWISLRPPSAVLFSHESGDKAVILQRTQTVTTFNTFILKWLRTTPLFVLQCIYNEWKGLFGWPSDYRALFGKSLREQASKSLRMVPFVLVEGGRWPQSDFVVVNMEGSRHALPLLTVYHKLQPVDVSPHTFLQAIFGHEYPVGILDEEKILPLGKAINVVGTCNYNDGVPEIKSCPDLPYFLSEMTKDQMVADLTFKTRILLWGGVVIGAMSIGVLGFAIFRNWNRWKEWRQQRRDQQANEAPRIEADDEPEEVPDGQLCTICLMRRRRSAFIPCGHMVCCQSCAISVQREVSPKCPLCRQSIRNSIRIFES